MLCAVGMAIVLDPQSPDRLGEAVGVLRQWQHDEAPMQLHPGDLGWYWRLGRRSARRSSR